MAQGGEIWRDNAWHTVTKAQITAELHQRRLSVLLCTDAASEGLNLQTAGALINYDLPWNPSKVEQRIPGIRTISANAAEVRIVNLFLKDSIDERVYRVLRDRCGGIRAFCRLDTAVAGAGGANVVKSMLYQIPNHFSGGVVG